MPFEIRKIGENKYKVFNKSSGATYSKKPFKTKAKAEAQLKAISINYYKRKTK